MTRTPLLWIVALALALGLGPAHASESEDGRPGRVVRVEHVASSMVTVPAGTFVMGFPGGAEEDEIKLACAREFGDEDDSLYCQDEVLWQNAADVRDVYLPAFDIDRYEVTVDDYRACAVKGACDSTALLVGAPEYLEEGLPMVNVTWRDAVDYCAWVGKRLPTEAEWEKAARGTDGRRWPWGNHDRRDGSNHGRVEQDPVRGSRKVLFHYVADDSDGAEFAVPPGTMKWSDSPYGVYDMAGNVTEWVSDYYRETYAGLTTIDPEVVVPIANFSMRVIRGGSWAEPRIFGRTYFRRFTNPDSRSFDRGFRCARDRTR